MLVCAFFRTDCTRDRGCSAHPAFPAPSSSERGETTANLGRLMPRECGLISSRCLKTESETSSASSRPSAIAHGTPGPITPRSGFCGRCQPPRPYRGITRYRRPVRNCALGPGRREGPPSRQLALAAQPQPFFGFELRHPQEMVEHVEAMTTGQFDQFGNSLRDEGYSLVRAALLPPWLIGLRSPIPDRSLALSAARTLVKKAASKFIQYGLGIRCLDWQL